MEICTKNVTFAQVFENALNCLKHRVTYKDLTYAYEKA